VVYGVVSGGVCDLGWKVDYCFCVYCANNTYIQAAAPALAPAPAPAPQHRKLVVFSAFDGMGAGRDAIRQLGIADENVVYLASEIDPKAIAVMMSNFPNTIQLGDITKVGYIPNIKEPQRGYFKDDKGKHHVVGKVDLFIGGSPCQGLSCAGTQKELDDLRSQLYLKWEGLLQNIEPTWWFFENVVNNDFRDFVSKRLSKFGAEHYRINSNVFAVADRRRDYWTNIPVKDIHKSQMRSPIGSPLEMSELIEDYRGIWVQISTRKCNTDGTYPSKVGYREGRKKMYTLTTDERHYPIDGAHVHLLEQDYTINRKHPETKETHKLHLTKSGVPFKMTRSGAIVDVRLTSDIERHQLLKREGAVFESKHYAQMMGFPIGYDDVCENKDDVLHMYGNGWTVPVICHFFYPVFYNGELADADTKVLSIEVPEKES
jgi:site-specific DNA-cytosine methylase